MAPHEEEQQQRQALARQINWLLSNACTHPASRRIADLTTSVNKYVRTRVTAADVDVCPFLIRTVIALNVAMRAPGVPQTHRSTLDDLLVSLVRSLRRTVHICKSSWPSVSAIISDAFPNDQTNFPLIEGVVRATKVVFKALEFSTGKSTIKFRNLLVEKLFPLFSPVFLTLANNDFDTTVKLSVVRCMSRIFTASVNCGLPDYFRSWPMLKEWLGYHVKIINSKIAVPEQGPTWRNPLAARVLNRCFRAFPHALQWKESIPEAMRSQCFKVAVHHAIAFYRANKGRLSCRDVFKSINELVDFGRQNFHAVLKPYVPVILIECLYPSLALFAKDREEEQQWDEDFAGVRLDSLLPVTSALISSLLFAYPDRQSVFVNILFGFCAKIADTYKHDKDNSDTAIQAEAVLRALSCCAKFIDDNRYQESLRSLFSDTFPRLFEHSVPLVQDATVRVCCAFITETKNTTPYHKFIDGVISTTNKHSPKHLRRGCLELVDCIVGFDLAWPIIDEHFPLIVDSIFAFLRKPKEETACGTLANICDVMHFRRRLTNYIAQMIDLAGGRLHLLRNDQYADGDDESPLVIQTDILLSIIADTVREHVDMDAENDEEDINLPQWSDSLRRLIRGLLHEDFIDLRAQALALLDGSILVLKDTDISSSKLVKGYFDATSSEYVIELGEVFKTYHMFEHIPSRRIDVHAILLERLLENMRNYNNAEESMFFLRWLVKHTVTGLSGMQACIRQFAKKVVKKARLSTADCALIASLLKNSYDQQFIKFVAKYGGDMKKLVTRWIEGEALREASPQFLSTTLDAFAYFIRNRTFDDEFTNKIKRVGIRLLAQHERTCELIKQREDNDEDGADDESLDYVNDGDDEFWEQEDNDKDGTQAFLEATSNE